MIKACLFDLDGTLLNTITSIRYYVNKSLSRYCLRNISESEAKVFVGNGARELVEKSLIAAGVDINTDSGRELCSKIHREYVDEYNDNPLYLTEAYRGIPETVRELSERGIKLAVISNKPDPTVKQLTEAFFGDTFGIVEGASEKFALKPCPDWPLDICKRLGVEPSSVMYLGDTSTDMKTARNFGAGIALGVLWGFRNENELRENGADAIVSEPSEILKLLK